MKEITVNESSKIISFFGLIVFIILTTLSYFDWAKEANPDIVSMISFMFNFLICAGWFASITFHYTKKTQIIHVLLFLFVGLGTILTTESYLSTLGEIIILFAILLMRVYEVYEDEFRPTVITTLSLSLISRLVSSILNDYYNLKELLGYIIIMATFYLIFYLFISRRCHMAISEAIKILALHEKKKVFIDLGERGYSELYHDYNGPEQSEMLSLAMELIEEGDLEEAKECLSDLASMMNRNNEMFASIKREVVDCLQREPVILNINDFVEDETLPELTKLEKSRNNPSVKIPKTDLRLIINSILSNAQRYYRKQLEIKISTKKDVVFIDIINDGKQFPHKYMKGNKVDLTMFTPGTTTRSNGSGYGIHNAVQYAQKNRGKIHAVSTDSSTTFRIILPLYIN